MTLFQTGCDVHRVLTRILFKIRYDVNRIFARISFFTGYDVYRIFAQLYFLQGITSIESVSCSSANITEGEFENSRMDCTEDDMPDRVHKEASFNLFAKFAKEVRIIYTSTCYG
jgi:hypothetical protein